MNDTQPANQGDIAELIEIIRTLNTRTGEQQVRIALLESALATLLFSAHAKGIPELMNSLGLVKLDWIEQGHPNTTVDIISILRQGPSPTGPFGEVFPRN